MSYSVQDYLDRHKLSIRIEEAVNAAVRAKTDDPVSVIARHLQRHAVAAITKVHARQLVDARGVPAVEAEVHTNRGIFHAIAPSAPSSGIYEAVEVRDGADDMAASDLANGGGGGSKGSSSGAVSGSRGGGGAYGEMGVMTAVTNVITRIGPALVGKDPREQADIDNTMASELDHTDNKGELGVNAILAVSLAVCKAGAAEKDVSVHQHVADLAGLPQLTLPAPVFRLIAGGPHVANGLPFQEVLCLPTGAESFSEALRIGAEVSHSLQDIVRERHGTDSFRTAGGALAPPLAGAHEALELAQAAVQRCGHSSRVRLALDAAARHLFCGDDGTYQLATARATAARAGAAGSAPAAAAAAAADVAATAAAAVQSDRRSSQELSQLYQSLAAAYGLAFVVDPFEQDDFDSMAALTADLAAASASSSASDGGLSAPALASSVSCQVLGGEVLVGNVKRISQAVATNACNGIVLTLPHMGTVSEALEAARVARSGSWTVAVAASPGDSEESVEAALAVGCGAHWALFGGLCGAQHTAKYNQATQPALLHANATAAAHRGGVGEPCSVPSSAALSCCRRSHLRPHPHVRVVTAPPPCASTDVGDATQHVTFHEMVQGDVPGEDSSHSASRDAYTALNLFRASGLETDFHFFATRWEARKAVSWCLHSDTV